MLSMREFLKSSGRWVRNGWFWPLVLLALPNCAIQPIPGLSSDVEHGPNPTSIVMCDIPKFTEAVQCATTEQDLKSGIPMNAAAIALNQKDQRMIGLDYSKAARDQCGGTNPMKVEFFGEFPDGYQLCLDCKTQIPNVYTSLNDVCRAQCEELMLKQPIVPPDPFAFCADTTRVHVSTNFKSCFEGTCINGSPDSNFNFKDNDPRRPQEPVEWIEQNGTKNGSMGNNLARTAGRSGNFDAGAFSKQTFTKGDGWVEFEVSDNTKQYAVALSHGGGPDPSETLDDMDFALVLQQGLIFVYEGGLPVNSFGPYDAGTRFRIKIKDNNDNVDPKLDTATITYSKLLAPCPPGPCISDFEFSGGQTKPGYPLRVDASLVDPGALLVGVTLVRIQEQP
jgi:hypothetical protein